ncbi:hypothetical protein EDB81DRAFT_778772 [Dactylonectria macrodidyma]|uniref:ABM domain-containing protein n=1 Tax=Dactylonectria macrodidyma TaxID=307937 RepID=A0A9P9FM94_9HYPO|nr:hypothetical protein EDB81DRAFT_778772 [Dactylonectria macrodidyma]
MEIPHFSEWSNRVGITIWTRFEAPDDPIDMAIFEPLAVCKPHLRTAYFGRIAESPRECLLVAAWRSLEAYDAFKKSPHYDDLMTNLTAQSTPPVQPQTQGAVFSRSWFNMTFGPNTEVLTAYFPSSTSPETQRAIVKTERLVHTLVPANPRCYKKPPTFAWVDGLQDRNGESAIACMWCHGWYSRELEERFKANERRRHPQLEGTARPLVVDVFDKDLKDLGLIEWESIHVNFARIPGLGL